MLSQAAFLFAGTFALLIHAELPVSPACDRTKPGKEFCDDFCNFRCGFYNSSVESGTLQNITFYRLSPKNVTGIRNKNSGDAPGDAYFYIAHGLSLMEACRKHPLSAHCLAADANNNLYGEYIVEVDGQFGPYLNCNANVIKSDRHEDRYDSQLFSCGIGCHNPTEKMGCTPPILKRNYSRTGTHDGAICWCDGTRRHERTVGVEFRKGASGVSTFPTGNLGGLWYSTPIAGECALGAPVGTNGCTWRVVKDVKYANASCVDGKISASVEKYGAKCFDSCHSAGQPLNRTSDCYFECYRHVLKGDAGFKTIPNELIVGPWSDAFKYDDPSEGGCPYEAPQPCKGNQCDPLLPSSKTSPSDLMV